MATGSVTESISLQTAQKHEVIIIV